VIFPSVSFLRNKNRYRHSTARSVIAAAAFFFLISLAQAQAQVLNPLASDPRAAQAGGAIFRAQCATCHGADAKGIDSIEAPDLTLIWARQTTTEASLFKTIKEGVAGSIMPPHQNPDPEIWMTVSYLKSIAISGTNETVVGNAGRGRNMFVENCSSCHRVDGVGGSLGPDLSSITGSRSLASLVNSLREPSSAIGSRFKPVSLTTATNERVQGTIKSEDAFSVQIMDSEQVLRAFNKIELIQFTREIDSLMPVFSEAVLTETDVNDILSYLQFSRGRRPSI
jgi:putative heme-binding domain-containing protein